MSVAGRIVPAFWCVKLPICMRVYAAYSKGCVDQGA